MKTTLQRSSTIYWQRLEDAERLNAAILEGFESHRNDPSVRRTHFFAGRYENIYVDRGRIPALDELLTAARGIAAGILELPVEDIAEGFWFNEMRPGQVTLPHSHDELDELLSATYYVSVPEGSGELVIVDGPARTSVKPRPGLLVLFDPELMHEVTENRSQQTRLSLGINFGLRRRSSVRKQT